MVSYSMVPPEIELDMKPQNTLHVQESPVPSPIATHPASPTQHTHQPLHKRLGTWTIGVLILSTLIICAVVIFLCLLWQNGNSPGTGFGWAHSIATADFTVKAITLSTVIMRLAIASQAGICTSLAAALMLERSSVPLPDLLHFAALRSINSGPPTILYPVVRQPRLYLRSLPAILISLIFLTTLALQLSSTILVIDTLNQDIPTSAETYDVAFANNNETQDSAYAKYLNVDYWGSRPLAYYSFGEIQRPHKQAENMHDTGIIYQGMPPSRNPLLAETLRGLDGVTTVFASRVVCVAPTIIEATVERPPAMMPGFYSYVSGNMTIGAETTDLVQCPFDNPDVCNIAFNCSLPSASLDLVNPVGQNLSAQSTLRGEWELGVCVISDASPWSFGSSLFDMPDSTVKIPEEETGDGQGYAASIFMVLNNTGIEASRFNDEVRSYNLGNETKKNHEWATFSLRNDSSVDLSLCFTKFEPRHKFVRMKSNRTLYPVQVAWDDEDWKYDTREVQRLFDPNTQIPSSRWGDRPREVMFMDMPTFDDTKIPAANITTFGIAAGEQFFKSDSESASRMLPGCFGCNAGNAVNLHPIMSSLIQDIVQRTRHPALALQAIFSIITHSAYYENSLTFNLAFQATVTKSMNTLLPGMWYGLMIVGGMLAFHLILVTWMVILFAKRTKYSIIGEMWHSVGQVMEHIPEHLLNQSMGHTDVEIRKACRRSGTSHSGVAVYGEGEVRERK